MVEYGGGINEGPAGQVGGENAPQWGAGGGDFFDNVGSFVNDSVNFISAQPTEIIVIAIVVAILGLAVLKRAF